LKSKVSNDGNELKIEEFDNLLGKKKFVNLLGNIDPQNITFNQEFDNLLMISTNTVIIKLI
jgi:hypothetical protein